MIDTPLCDDKEQLVAYLYDELDAVVRRRVDDHLRICAGCASELTALSGVRRELAEWRPPDVASAFSIVPTPRLVTTPAAMPVGNGWRPARVPAWAQAAAAVLVVAAGLAIANLQVRYNADGLVVTTGWMGTTPASPGTVSERDAPAGEQAAAEWRTALTTLESSLRDEMRSLRQQEPTPAAGSARTAELPMTRVADLIAESERRQQQELALRLAQLGRDLEVQRRSDLVRINQGFGQFEGRAGAEIARQRQMLDYIMRVSAPPPQ